MPHPFNFGGGTLRTNQKRLYVSSMKDCAVRHSWSVSMSQFTTILTGDAALNLSFVCIGLCFLHVIVFSPTLLVPGCDL